MSFQPIDKKITYYGLVGLLMTSKTVSDINLDYILYKLSIKVIAEQEQIIAPESKRNYWTKVYKMKLFGYKYITFYVAYNEKTYAKTIVKKKITDEHDQLASFDGRPSEVLYDCYDGSIVYEMYHNAGSLYETHFYTYDEFGESVIEKNILFNKSLTSNFNISVGQIFIRDDIVVDAVISVVSPTHKNTLEDITYSHFIDTFSRFKDIDVNEFKRQLATVTADESKLLEMWVI